MPTNINLPANLPENWQTSQIVSPSGTDVGLSAQHGYNYLMQQVNDTQEAANTLSQAVDAQEEAQAQLETDVDTLQTDMAQAKSDVETLQTDVGELQTDVGNLQTGQGQLATPNATATHSDSVVAITAPAGVNLISFYAPSDFSGDDTYTVNGSAVALTDLNGNAVYDGWKEGAPVQLILKGTQAFFKSGGGVNDTLPPLNPNMTGELADGVFTVTADKLPVSQADALAGAEWYYADHVPARPGDGTKVELTRRQLAEIVDRTANDYNHGDIVKIRENGSPVEYIISAKDYESALNGAGRVLVVRAAPDKNGYYENATNNAYAGSVIEEYNNSSFKNRFSSYVQDLIGETTFYQTPGGGDNTVTTMTRSIFNPSATEMGFSEANMNVEGTALPVAGLVKTMLAESGYDGIWTRSPVTSGTNQTWEVKSDGTSVAKNIYLNSGYLECFTLPSTALFDPDTNELIEDAGISTLADTTNLGGSAAGSTVTLMENGVAAEYLVLQQGYPTAGNGNTLLRRKDAVDQMAWDSGGVNAYSDSSVDSYLSGDYIERFTPNMQAMLQIVNISSAAGNGNTTVGAIPRKAFILSYAEAGFPTHANAPAEGTAIPYFDSDAKRVVQLNGVAVNQWTRTPFGSSTTNAWIILNTGAVSSGAVTGQYGIAPCIVLKSDVQVNPDGSIVESDNSPVVTLSIPWTSSSYIYVRQFPFNSKHQYQTQLVGAVATNDPDYSSGSIAPGIPDFSYTGNYAIIDDGDGNKRVKFYTSGTLVMSKTCVVDAFYVGGGSGGASQASTSGFAPGGGGGYTATHHAITLEANTEYAITIGAGGVGTSTLTPSNGGETNAFGFSISGGQGANGGSGGGATGLSRDNNHNAEGGDGGSNGLGGEKAYHYTASTSGTTESTTQGTGQGTTTAEFGEEGNELYSGGGGGAGLWTNGGSTRRAIGGNGGAGGETNSGGIGGNTNSWDGASGNAVSNEIGGQGGKISRPSSSDYHPAGGGGGGGYGGGGGAGACGRGNTGQGGNGYQGIVIIRNHREAS